MTEKRRIETIGLRNFFAEQWSHLNLFWNQTEEQKTQRHLRKKRLKDAVENLVEGTAPSIRVIDSYHSRLRQSTNLLIQHIDQLSDEFPYVTQFSSDNYAKKPLIRTLFYKPKDMFAFFSNHREIRAFLDEPANRDVENLYFLLLAKKNEKTRIGHGIVNGELRRNVLQTSVNFKELRLLAPSNSESVLVKTLKTWLYDEVVASLRQKINSQSQSTQTKGHKQKKSYHFNHFDPEKYMDILESTMATPEKLLHLNRVEINTDKFGLKVDVGDEQLRRHFVVTEVTVANRGKRFIIAGSYSSAELNKHVQV